MQSKVLASVIFGLMMLATGCTKINITPQEYNIGNKAQMPTSTPETSPSPETVAQEQTEKTIALSISSNGPIYTFHIVNQTETSTGYIEISNSSSTVPFQKISIDPTMPHATNIALTFAANDIDFDGYLDIGVEKDGGAKWSNEQYWVYNKYTHTFVTNEFTKEFGNMGHNNIKFDNKNKRIMINNFDGPYIGKKATYIVQNGHLVLWEEFQQEQKYNEDGPIEKCTIIHQKNTNGKIITTTDVLNQVCIGYGFNL